MPGCNRETSTNCAKWKPLTRSQHAPSSWLTLRLCVVKIHAHMFVKFVAELRLKTFQIKQYFQKIKNLCKWVVFEGVCVCVRVEFCFVLLRVCLCCLKWLKAQTRAPKYAWRSKNKAFTHTRAHTHTHTRHAATGEMRWNSVYCTLFCVNTSSETTTTTPTPTPTLPPTPSQADRASFLSANWHKSSSLAFFDASLISRVEKEKKK